MSEQIYYGQVRDDCEGKPVVVVERKFATLKEAEAYSLAVDDVAEIHEHDSISGGILIETVHNVLSE